MNEIEPGDALDGFLVVRVLARSAMGSIFRARQQATGRDVVLKVPHPALECDIVYATRFQREERIAQRLNHPAIVRALVVPEKSRPYIVMDHVEGQTLWETVKTRRGQPAEWVLEVGRQVCAALAYMHGEGVVHRDLKPENILIDAAGAVHLIDFGIALDLLARRVTWGRFSGRLGTPEYMAPERIEGKRGDARTDLYALGTILYELLSGQAPYETTDALELMKVKRKRDPRPLERVAPGVDPAVAAIVMRAIARKPEDRLQDAGEMLSVLREPSRLPIVARRLDEDHRIESPAMARALIWAAMFCAAILGALWMVVPR